ncbi:MAG TPA: ABC transporter permease, partial [Abditibacteriaceae bacterium]|nr:ABC transporter permease [Abditibacteriaceae bacterium]
MSASSATMESANRVAASAGRSDRIHVPTSWRVGQCVVTGLILLLAAYYNTQGWQNPVGESPRPLPSRGEWLSDQVGFLILIALVWLTTPTAGVIAMTTFHEAVRRRWMSALLAFALVMLALSTFFTWMQPGEEEKFLRDFGTGFIVIITLLMAIFLGASLVPPEIERRTIFTILSKPVNRLEFIIGKFL